MERWIALDLETTGLSPTRDEIRELAAVPVGIEGQAEHVLRFMPGEFQVLSQTTARASEELLVVLNAGSFLTTHNAAFHARVLAACLDHYGLDSAPLRSECTLRLARDELGIRPTSLAFVCELLSIPLRHHDALSDAEAAARVVLRALECAV
jgi:DNA polymerase III epsilon subunit-like protein